MKLIRLVLSLTLLTGCAVIPHTSKVEVVQDIEIDVDGAASRAIVRPPVIGMGALEIAQGFINAHADPTANYEIARLYLNNTFTKVWKAKSIEIVDSPSVVFELLDTNLVSMTYSKIGTLSPNGELEFLEKPLTQVALFEMKRQHGEFRIVQALNRAFISTADLTRSYSAQQIFFFNADYTRLVPVSRWLPGSDVALATRLVNELLLGPDSGLEVALRSAIPAETELAINAVLRNDGVLVVNLTGPALGAVENQRAAMIAQIARSLSRVGFEITIQVNNQPLALGGETVFRTSDFPEYFITSAIADYPINYVKNGLLYRGTIDETTLVRSLEFSAKYAISPDGAQIAISNGELTRVESVNQLTVLRQIRVPVRSFAFDYSNNLWLVLNDGRVQVSLPGGEIAQVNGLDGLKVQSLSMSADGVQIALIVSTADGPQLKVGYIYQSGNAFSVQNPERVERLLGDVLSVDWAINGQLMILAISAANEPLVYQLNGAAFEPSVVNSPLAFSRISLAPGEPLLAEDLNGGIWVYQAGQWRFAGLGTGARYVD